MKTSSSKKPQSGSLVAAAADAETAAVERTGRTVLLLIGVSGSGKATIAPQRVLDGPMRIETIFTQGLKSCDLATPLTFRTGWPGPKATAAWIDGRRDAGEPGIIICSNLKRAYAG